MNYDDLKMARILLVDDDEADRALTAHALRQVKLLNELSFAEDGESALALLEDPALPLPDLILLDINMPGMNGHELLERLKDHDSLRRIPVVMLTSSDRDEDVGRAYHAYCSGYVRKPVDIAGLQKVVQILSDYWFVLVRRPT